MQANNRRHKLWHNSLFFIGAFLIALAIIWQIVKQANHNRQLQQQATEKEAEIRLLEQQNKNLQLENEYRETDYYLELSIRKQTGLTRPGESVFIIGDSKVEALYQQYSALEKENRVSQPEKSNLQKWWHFLFERQP